MHSIYRRFKGIRLSLVVAAVPVLIACSTFVYEPAKAPDAATVRVVNHSRQHLRVMESQKANCKDMWRFGNNDVSDFVPPGQSVQTKANPGTMFVFTTIGGVRIGMGIGSPGSIPISVCAPLVGFVPEPNANYEVAYAFTPSGCSIDVIRVDGATRSAVVLSKIDLHNKIGPQWCEVAK